MTFSEPDLAPSGLMIFSTVCLIISFTTYLIIPEFFLISFILVPFAGVLTIIESNYSTGFSQLPESALGITSFEESKSNTGRVILSLSISTPIGAFLSSTLVGSLSTNLIIILWLLTAILCVRYFLKTGSGLSSTSFRENTTYVAGMMLLIIFGFLVITSSNDKEELIYLSFFQLEDGDIKIYDSDLELDEEYHYRLEIFSNQKENYTAEVRLILENDGGDSVETELIYEFESSHITNLTNIFNFTIIISEPGPFRLDILLLDNANPGEILRETEFYLSAGS